MKVGGKQLALTLALVIASVALWGIALEPAAADDREESVQLNPDNQNPTETQDIINELIDVIVDELSGGLEPPSGEIDVDEQLQLGASVDLPERLCQGGLVSCDPWVVEFDSALTVDGETVSTSTVTADTGETLDIDITHSFSNAGCKDVQVDYQIRVDGNLVQDNTIPRFQSANICVESVINLDEVEGAAFTVPEAMQDEVLSFRDAQIDIEDSPIDLPVVSNLEPFILANEDELHIVFSEQEPTTGYAEVSGITLDSPFEGFPNMDFSVTVASNTQFTESGEPTDLSSIETNPQAHHLEPVRIDAHHRSIALRTDPGLAEFVSYPTTTGILTDDPVEAEEIFGQLGGATEDALLEPERGTYEDILQVPSQPHLFTHSYEPSFWKSHEVTADGIVLTPGTKAWEFVETFDPEGAMDLEAQEPILYIFQEQHSPNGYADIASVNQDADDAELVSVQANVFQVTVSLQDTIEAVLASSPVLPHDAIVHGGVAWNSVPHSTDETLPLVGVSSQAQTIPADAGEYAITGEVVSSQKLDESLPDGKVLVVYEMDLIDSGLSLDELPNDSQQLVESQAEQNVEALQEQTDAVEEDLDGPIEGDPADEDDDGLGFIDDAGTGFTFVAVIVALSLIVTRMLIGHRQS